MKFVLLVVCVAVLAVLTEGRSYYDRRYKKGSGGVVCPTRPCTLEFIPPECRRYDYFTHNGRRCRGCPINICRGGGWNSIGGGNWNGRGRRWGNDQWGF